MQIPLLLQPPRLGTRRAKQPPPIRVHIRCRWYDIVQTSSHFQVVFPRLHSIDGPEVPPPASQRERR